MPKTDLSQRSNIYVHFNYVGIYIYIHIYIYLPYIDSNASLDYGPLSDIFSKACENSDIFSCRVPKSPRFVEFAYPFTRFKPEQFDIIYTIYNIVRTFQNGGPFQQQTILISKTCEDSTKSHQFLQVFTGLKSLYIRMYIA